MTFEGWVVGGFKPFAVLGCVFVIHCCVNDTRSYHRLVVFCRFFLLVVYVFTFSFSTALSRKVECSRATLGLGGWLYA